MSSAPVETRAAKVAFASGLSVVLSIALQLLSVPICLRFWGNETYGLWLAIFAVFSVIRTLDSGFGGYVGNEINLLYHKDQVALRKTLASGLAGAVVLGAIQVVAAALIVASGSLAELSGAAPEAARNAQADLALCVLVFAWVPAGTWISVVHRLLVPAGMLHQSTWWLMGFQITQAAALVAAAALRLEISETALLFSVAHLVFYLASAVYVARVLPEYFPWWRQPSWMLGLRHLYRSTVVIGAAFLTQVSSSGLVMLISSRLGAAAVPDFTTVRTVANLWTMLGSVLIAPLIPEIVRYHAQRDPRKLGAALEANWLIANCAVNLSVLACFPFLDEFYRFWTGGRVVLDDSLLCYLLLSVVVSMPAALITSYLVSVNELRAVTGIFAARSLVPLAAGVALMPSLALAGVGIAVVLGEIAGPIALGLPYFRRQLRDLGAVGPIAAWQPMAAGSSAVAIFLLARAIGTAHLEVVYVLSLACVVSSALWGWRRVGVDVRERAIGLLRRINPLR